MAQWLLDHGIEDKVQESSLDGIPDSLKLIEVSDLSLRVAFEPGWQGRPGSRKVRGSFNLEPSSIPAGGYRPARGNGLYDEAGRGLSHWLSHPLSESFRTYSWIRV
jgi:hypothetical protein